MAFTTDQQTLDDLHIFGRQGSDSISEIFNHTATRGGARVLEDMFRQPLSDEKEIHKRIGIFQFFAKKGKGLPFRCTDFELIEPYLSSRDERTRLSVQEQTIVSTITNLVALDADTLMIHKGIGALQSMLVQLKAFTDTLELVIDHPYFIDCETIRNLIGNKVFVEILDKPSQSKLSVSELAAYDEVFRFTHRDLVLELLGYLYEMDVYFTIARIATLRGFTFPIPNGQRQGLQIEGLYHPQVENAVPNSIAITPQSHVLFLTGANMAGKSTFMKSLSVALYLAHMGFPVAASRMEFAVLDGMYTTINLPDDLGAGTSHFYAEVLRAKKVASELLNKRLFVLFDELFRGTNVKDACEATIAFTEAFSKKHDSIFVISTHIIEAGEILKESCTNINFLYLPTLMEGNKPIYTYQLKQGITADRHGMVIIKNEKIIELLGEERVIGAELVNNDFVTDPQTLLDLNLLGKYKPSSIYSLFNKVKTAGGERLLNEMFQ